MSFLLHKKGIPHLLVGREEKQRPLALGETLPPSALPLLQSMGLLALFEAYALKKTTGYHSAWGSNHVTDHNFYFHRPFQYGLKLNKESLINALEEQQQEYIREEGRLTAITQTSGAIRVDLDNGKSIEGALVVDATGRKRVVSQALGVEQVEKDQLMCFSCHVPTVRVRGLPHGVFVEPFESGWGIVSELSVDTSVMTLFTTKNHEARSLITNYENWPELLGETRHLKSFLSPLNEAKVMGSKANSSRLTEMAGVHWLAIGDAAMAFDPLSSHGITSGIYTAQQAVEAIAKVRKEEGGMPLQDYSQTLTRIFEGYLQQKRQLYRQERRWEERSFWQEVC